MSLIQSIDALLPQTQCGKCGHPGCRPYAEGLASGEAINKCPPGGDETIAQLAQLLNVPIIDLDPERGTAPPQVAFIREAECIGCTKCIQACPVDAILGAAKLMHTVIIDECTGCDLCVAPCPVDCIEMRPVDLAETTPVIGNVLLSHAQFQARSARRNNARQRFEARNARLKRDEDQRLAERLARAHRPTGVTAPPERSLQTVADRDAQKPVDTKNALKQSRIAVTMARNQLNRSLKAFGHPPIAEQAARLVELQMEFEAAEKALEALSESSQEQSATIAAGPDQGSLNRAKIQLAMRRAALKKAHSTQMPAEQLSILSAAVYEAEEALRQFGALPAVSNSI